MTTTFKVHASELNYDFLERLKTMFQERDLEIVVYEADVMDETEFLLRDPVNRKHLLEAIGRVERREGLVEVDIASLQ